MAVQENGRDDIDGLEAVMVYGLYLGLPFVEPKRLGVFDCMSRFGKQVQSRVVLHTILLLKPLMCSFGYSLNRFYV